MEMITAGDRLGKLGFPAHCLRCMNAPADARMQIIETTDAIRRLHQPFSLVSVLIFLASGALVAVLGQRVEMSLMWTWLFVYVFIVSLLRNFYEKSQRVITLPYCKTCLKLWERDTQIEYLLVFTFIFASSAAFFFGLHRVYPALIPLAWAGSLLIYRLGRGRLHRHDPPLDLHQFQDGSVSLNFGNRDFAKQTLAMNKGLKGAFECRKCKAFVALPSRQCPKCDKPTAA